MDDEDVIEEYRDALYDVKSHLMSYGLSSITGNHVRNVARMLDKLHRKKHVKGGLESAVLTAGEVDDIVTNLYRNYDGYLPMWKDSDLKLMLQAEASRLRSIARYGSRGLFERFEEDNVRQDFRRGRRAGRNNSLDLSYRKLIEELGLSRLPGLEATRFISAVRSVDTYRPVEIRESYAYSLINCYRDLETGEKSAPLYLAKLADAAEATSDLAGSVGMDVDRDRALSDFSIQSYIDWVDEELKILEDIYVELVARRLESVV